MIHTRPVRVTRATPGLGALRLVAAAGAASGAGALAANVGWGSRFGGGQGCMWNASSYCAMAEGRLGAPPFSRRPLVPGIVRILHFGSLADRFLLVNAVAVALTLVFVGVLGRRVAAHLGAAPQRARAAGLAAAGLMAAAPFAGHLLLFFPTLTDYGATMLCLAWFVGLTSADPRWHRVAPAIAVVAVAAREQSLGPILAVAAVAAVTGLRRRPALLSALVGTAMLAGDLALPSSGPNAASLHDLVRYAIRKVASPGGMLATVAGLTIACGALLIVPVLHRRWIARTTSGSADARLLIRGAAAMIVADVALGLLGGTDTARIASHAAPIVIALAVGVGAAADDGGLILVLGLSSILAWRPWLVMTDAGSYVGFVAPQFVPQVAARLALSTLILAGLPFPVRAVLSRLRAARTRVEPHAVPAATRGPARTERLPLVAAGARAAATAGRPVG